MWDWGQQQDALQQERLAVKQLQVLGIFDPTLPTKLDVPATQEKSGCELGNSDRVWVPDMTWSRRMIQYDRETITNHMFCITNNRTNNTDS